MILVKNLNFLQYVIPFSQIRSISSSSCLYGKRNFRKFHFPNKRGTVCDRRWLRQNPQEYDHQGMRVYGHFDGKRIIPIPELVPELVVPDLTDFELKPYVSYRTADITQEKFTAKHLFFSTYAKKMHKDFKEGLLDEEGNSLKPSEDEKMTAEEAKIKIRQTGSDLFG